MAASWSTDEVPLCLSLPLTRTLWTISSTTSSTLWNTCCAAMPPMESLVFKKASLRSWYEGTDRLFVSQSKNDGESRPVQLVKPVCWLPCILLYALTFCENQCIFADVWGCMLKLKQELMYVSSKDAPLRPVRKWNFSVRFGSFIVLLLSIN